MLVSYPLLRLLLLTAKLGAGRSACMPPCSSMDAQMPCDKLDDTNIGIGLGAAALPITALVL